MKLTGGRSLRVSLRTARTKDTTELAAALDAEKEVADARYLADFKPSYVGTPVGSKVSRTSFRSRAMTSGCIARR